MTKGKSNLKEINHGKKYEFTDETIEFDGYLTLYRIRALKDFRDIKAGDLGGFVEYENNLSHENDCWIYNDARFIPVPIFTIVVRFMITQKLLMMLMFLAIQKFIITSKYMMLIFLDTHKFMIIQRLVNKL
ncbi:hypothetical protein [Bartonella tribocorum]|uniref:hypothetical protein n=1 Tax=Bartonella tribocorum TaxID=85701 RepID=UPI001FDFCDF3|nr:hypothetical protein [Bartonella tribocorum]